MKYTYGKKAEAVAYAKAFGAWHASRRFDIPERTIKGWIKKKILCDPECEFIQKYSDLMCDKEHLEKKVKELEPILSRVFWRKCPRIRNSNM